MDFTQHRFWTLALLAASSLRSGRACRIHGTESGICVDPIEDQATFGLFTDLMPFCGGESKDGDPPIVSYRACIPLESDFPSAKKHTVTEKDNFVREFFERIVEERQGHERNETLEDRGVNEMLEGGEIIPRFSGYKTSDDCINAYKRYFCYLNFPACDEEDHSLLMCRSACENLHKACQFESDLWRCGEPEYLYGYSGEVSREKTPEPHLKNVYYRYPYPGAPFSDYQEKEGVPLLTCTPSVKGSAPPALGAAALRITALATVASTLLVYLVS
eukprot:g2918.t1